MQKGAIVSPSAILLPVSRIKSHGLPRREILRGTRNFQLLNSLGKRLYTPTLTLRGIWLMLRIGGSPIKVAFQVPRRAMRRAVHRRRSLRILREAYRLQKPAFLAHHPGGELWLLWRWQQPNPPSLAQTQSLMWELYLRFLQTCAT
ncbi:MAG: ribonuclease P protein component [Bacteroidia bacterium]|nr:ribonuclease P protein component [Bacteroidia bacterium]MDW8236374.1 ribonuclease P protein component [Bacteroidia bacterium]